MFQWFTFTLHFFRLEKYSGHVKKRQRQWKLRKIYVANVRKIVHNADDSNNNCPRIMKFVHHIKFIDAFSVSRMDYDKFKCVFFKFLSRNRVFVGQIWGICSSNLQIFQLGSTLFPRVFHAQQNGSFHVHRRIMSNNLSTLVIYSLCERIVQSWFFNRKKMVQYKLK